MLKKIKKHIFVVVFGIFFGLYIAFLALIFFAPRVDLYERGFVKCTKNMIADFSGCTKNKLRCATKAMFQNHACDFKVIQTGVLLWLKGDQKTPWANYYFEPVTEEPNPTEDEELQAYYKQHLDMVKEMEELNQKYFELDKQLTEQERQIPQHPQQDKGKEKNDAK